MQSLHSLVVFLFTVPWSSPSGRSSHGGGAGVGGPSSLDGDVAMSSFDTGDLGERLQVGGVGARVVSGGVHSCHCGFDCRCATADKP